MRTKTPPFRIYLVLGPPALLFVFRMSSDDAEVSRDITAHVGKVRGVLEQMDHTFEMARARSELRAAINGLRQNSAATTPASQREEQPRGLGWASATGEAGDVGKEVGRIRIKPRDVDVRYGEKYLSGWRWAAAVSVGRGETVANTFRVQQTYWFIPRGCLEISDWSYGIICRPVTVDASERNDAAEIAGFLPTAHTLAAKQQAFATRTQVWLTATTPPSVSRLSVKSVETDCLTLRRIESTLHVVESRKGRYVPVRRNP